MPTAFCVGMHHEHRHADANGRRHGALASSLLFLLLFSGAALGQTPRELLDNGNEQFEAADYAAALESYEQIDEEADAAIRAELLHNLAAANFKLGNLDDARELWVRAAGLKDEGFESAARYNLGNCDYADAIKAAEGQDAQGALELLDRAMAQYRDAVRLDSQRADARANLELAAQLKKQIEEMSEQQPESQPSSEQQDDEQQQDQQDQSSSQPSSQPSDQDQQKQDQDQSDSQDQQSEDGEQDDSDQDQQDQPQPETQPSPESQPSQQPRPDEAKDGGEEEKQPQPTVQIEMTREQAERLLQKIRDAERQRRAILRAREAARHKPVEKDW